MELTHEQKEIIREFAEKIVDVFKKFCEAVNKIFEKVKAYFNKFIYKMEPHERYKYLKSIGIRYYEPFFQRRGIIRCRNNC